MQSKMNYILKRNIFLDMNEVDKKEWVRKIDQSDICQKLFWCQFPSPVKYFDLGSRDVSDILC